MMAPEIGSYVPYYCSDQELVRRWDAVAAAMKKAGVDYIVAGSQTDYIGQYVKWFTDFPTQSEYQAMVIFSQDKEMASIWSWGGVWDPANPVPANVVPPTYAARGIARRWSRGLFSSFNYTCTYDAEIVVHELRGKGKIRVGLVGPAFMTIQACNHIAEHLPQAEIIDFTGEIDAIKAVKSEEELAILRDIAGQQDDVMRALKDYIRPGISELDILTKMKHLIDAKASENGIYKVGSNSFGAPAHPWHEHFHSKRVIEKGDTVTCLI